jgi:sugar phosphate isomerase/epimerase
MADDRLPIGSTSWAFYNMDIFQIAELLGKNDLGLEIHLNDFDEEIGDPRPLVQGGVWPRTFGQEDRRKLRQITDTLPVLTVHGTPWDLNYLTNNPGIREESIRQYEEAMDMAHDLGAAAMTYHTSRGGTPLTPADVRLQRHVDFARRIAPRAERYSIPTGLENGADYNWFMDIIRAVDSPMWGHLLDIGHAIMKVKGDTDTVLEWIDYFGVERLSEIHAHNVIGWSAGHKGFFDHQTFEDGTCLDMPTIFAKLKDIGYTGPIIFEILQNTPQKVIDACLRAKDVVYKAYGL